MEAGSTGVGEGLAEFVLRWSSAEVREALRHDPGGGDEAGGVVLAHEVEVGVAGEVPGEPLGDEAGVGEAVGEDEMPDEEAAPGEAAMVEDQVADLSVHLLDGAAGYLGVVLGERQPAGDLRPPELEVGQVDVDDPVEDLEGRDGLVTAAVVDDGQAEAGLGGDDERLQDLGQDVGGGDPIEVVAAAILEVEHDPGELVGADAPAFVFVAGLPVLTEDAAQVAAGEEDGPGTAPASEAVLFAVVRTVAGYPGEATAVAEPGLAGVAGGLASAGTHLAMGEPGAGDPGAAGELAGFGQLAVSRPGDGFHEAVAEVSEADGQWQVAAVIDCLSRGPC